MTSHYTDMRAWRVPVPCNHDGCPAVNHVHYKHADTMKARGWLCPDHEPPDLDPELTHGPGCRGSGSTSRRPDGSVQHRCFGCGATRTCRPDQGQEVRSATDPTPAG